MSEPTQIARVFLLLTGALLSLACGGGDGGSTEWSRPGHYETPAQGVAEGPEGEVIRLGTDPGVNRQEQSPAEIGADAAADPLDCLGLNSCEQACVCLGGDAAGCNSYCREYYGDSYDEYDYSDYSNN